MISFTLYRWNLGMVGMILGYCKREKGSREKSSEKDGTRERAYKRRG
jgi:hypothetical protein